MSWVKIQLTCDHQCGVAFIVLRCPWIICSNPTSSQRTLDIIEQKMSLRNCGMPKVWFSVLNNYYEWYPHCIINDRASFMTGIKYRCCRSFCFFQSVSCHQRGCCLGGAFCCCGHLSNIPSIVTEPKLSSSKTENQQQQYFSHYSTAKVLESCDISQVYHRMEISHRI